jgi:hypothetical protein
LTRGGALVKDDESRNHRTRTIGEQSHRGELKVIEQGKLRSLTAEENIASGYDRISQNSRASKLESLIEGEKNQATSRSSINEHAVSRRR